MEAVRAELEAKEAELERRLTVEKEEPKTAMPPPVVPPVVPRKQSIPKKPAKWRN